MEAEPLLPASRLEKRKRRWWPPLVVVVVSICLFALSTRRGENLYTMLATKKRRAITKAYYINCESSTVRRDFMESWLSEYGLEYERFECIHADTVEELSSKLPSRLKFRDLRRNGFDFEGVQLARSIACYASHYALLELISRQKEGLYVLLEDDVSPAVDLGSLESAAATLPSDWIYAGLNVHDSICLEDLDGPWALRRQFPGGNWQVKNLPEKCTPKRMSSTWQANDYYFSDSAAFVTPQNAKAVLDHFDSRPLMPNDSVLMTKDRRTFASFVYGGDANLFVHSEKDLPEDRATVVLVE